MQGEAFNYISTIRRVITYDETDNSDRSIPFYAFKNYPDGLLGTFVIEVRRNGFNQRSTLTLTLHMN